MKKQTTIKHLQLPFQFDEQKLVHDLNSISEKEWMPHHYTHNYDGEWNSLALYTENGNDKDTYASINSSQTISETQLLKKAPYFKEVLSHFKAPFQAVRLLRLTPGSIIKPHVDHHLGYENNNFRLHIPITTNNQIEFVLGGDRLKMMPGECWYTNVNFIHSVANKGKKDRVHLVIDCERNDWSDELFFSLAPREAYALNDDYSIETTKRIILELEKNNDPASIELVSQLKEKLK